MLSQDLRNIAATLLGLGQRGVLGLETPIDFSLLGERIDAIAAGVESLEVVTVPAHLRGVIPVEQLSDRVVALPYLCGVRPDGSASR